MKPPYTHSIESLESRIAPAALFVSPKSATVLEPDGDLVVVKFSKPLLTASNVDDVIQVGESGGIKEIDLTGVGQSARGTDITVTVRRGAGLAADGFANIGFIDADGIDLGKVTALKSDVGRIVAGDATMGGGILRNPTPGGAAKSISVGAMGMMGLDTQDGDGDLMTVLRGSVGSLKVARNVDGAVIDLFGGRVGALSIGGSLIEGAVSNGAATRLSIGGHVIGGDAEREGYIDLEFVASAKIGGSIFGGTAPFTGYVKLTDGINGLALGGSLNGGTASDTGVLVGSGFFSISVGGDIRGGDVTTEGQVLERSGYFQGGGPGSTIVKGSLVAGVNDTMTGHAVHNATLISGSSTVKVTGMMGNVGAFGATTSPELGVGPKTKAQVLGDVIYGTIGTTPRLGDAPASGVDSISIRGNLISSNIAIGVEPGIDGILGNSDDILGGIFELANFPIISIKSISIAGAAIDSNISAEAIARLTINGGVIPLTSGKSNDSFVLGGDVHVVELTRPVLTAPTAATLLVTAVLGDPNHIGVSVIDGPIGPWSKVTIRTSAFAPTPDFPLDAGNGTIPAQKPPARPATIIGAAPVWGEEVASYLPEDVRSSVVVDKMASQYFAVFAQHSVNGEWYILDYDLVQI